MAIKSIVVHPKGATHKDHIGYWLKQVDGEWHFYCSHPKRWVVECLVGVRITPITEL